VETVSLEQVGAGELGLPPRVQEALVELRSGRVLSGSGNGGKLGKGAHDNSLRNRPQGGCSCCSVPH